MLEFALGFTTGVFFASTYDCTLFVSGCHALASVVMAKVREHHYQTSANAESKSKS